MYFARIAVVRRQPGTDFDASLGRARDELAPLLAQRPGYVAYEVVRVGNDLAVSVSHWQSRDAADASQRFIQEWVRGNLASQLAYEADYMGEVQFGHVAGQKAA